MEWLIMAVAVTLSVVFFCSLAEAMILSTTATEIEALKKADPVRGVRLDELKSSVDDTVSAILALRIITAVAGSAAVGVFANDLFPPAALAWVILSYAFVLLVFSHVIPRNLGAARRVSLQPRLIGPLLLLCRVTRPVTYVSGRITRLFVKPVHVHEDSDQEIILLAERGAKQGTLTRSESNIIANALSLDDVRVDEIMTPRTVVTTLPKSATVGEIFKEYPNIPFARIPVYGKNIDDVVGLVRRRDLLKAKANDLDSELVERLMQDVSFIPETVTAANALQVFLKTHQQLLVVVDEFGATAGVVTMEDVMEHLLGREIFEKDDMAVDMRELARAKLQKQTRNRRAGEHPPPSNSGSKPS